MRVRVLRELLNEKTRFATWWTERATSAAGTATQDDWLRLAADCEAAAGVALDLSSADLGSGSTQLFLNTGASPSRGSAFEADLVSRVLAGECPDVTSVRSHPAQVAVALSPSNYLTSATNSFFEPDARAKNGRRDAITALRKSGSPFAVVAKERAFKAGQKSSTFPWADSATAIFDQIGPCWLASEIAIIGAASPLNLGYTKHPGMAAFGKQAHPAELLAQTRQNADDISWWTAQLKTTTDETAKSEWSLALWAVASGSVLDSLLQQWQETVQALSDDRRAVVTRSAAQIARYGWVRKRQITTCSSDAAFADLIELRGSTVDKANGPATTSGIPAPAVANQPSLLSVARSAKWLKVDSVATYR